MLYNTFIQHLASASSGALVDQYAELPLALVDATVLACTERLRELKLATLDRRHFSVVRVAHTDHLELLPD